jgi:hypothetical protein
MRSLAKPPIFIEETVLRVYNMKVLFAQHVTPIRPEQAF